MKLIRLLAITLLVSTVIIAGCDKNNPSCVPFPNSFIYTLDAYDAVDTTSVYFNKRIATFSFTQSTTSYSGVGNCPSENCSINLKIQNLTPKKVTFKYNIGLIYNNNATTFTVIDSTTLDSMATNTIGTLSNNCSVVTAPTTTVQLSHITYQ